MAAFTGELYSKALNMDTGVRVILPGDRDARAAADCPVLYLLHGLSDSCGGWSRYTSIERYANARGLAIVMPEVQHSFYTDMANGLQYYTYVAEELPERIGSLFHISQRPEDSFIAGLSMGGYGALKIALRNPGRYRAAAGFSSAIDIKQLWQERSLDPAFSREMRAIFGEGPQPEDDVFALAERAAREHPDELPRIYTACGLSDGLLESNRRFRDLMQSLPYDYRWEAWEGGHEWAFWDTAIQKAFRFFFDE